MFSLRNHFVLFQPLTSTKISRLLKLELICLTFYSLYPSRPVRSASNLSSRALLSGQHRTFIDSQYPPSPIEQSSRTLSTEELIRKFAAAEEAARKKRESKLKKLNLSPSTSKQAAQIESRNDLPGVMLLSSADSSRNDSILKTAALNSSISSLSAQHNVPVSELDSSDMKSSFNISSSAEHETLSKNYLINDVDRPDFYFLLDNSLRGTENLGTASLIYDSPLDLLQQSAIVSNASPAYAEALKREPQSQQVQEKAKALIRAARRKERVELFCAGDTSSGESDAHSELEDQKNLVKMKIDERYVKVQSPRFQPHFGRSLHQFNSGSVLRQDREHGAPAIAVLDQPMARGSWHWGFTLLRRQDISWVGVTDDPESLDKCVDKNAFRSCRNFWGMGSDGFFLNEVPVICYPQKTNVLTMIYFDFCSYLKILCYLLYLIINVMTGNAI